MKPEMFCPSHGEPMKIPTPAIGETIKRLTAYYRFQTGSDPRREPAVRREPASGLRTI